jgi:hypothetical protein
MDDLLRFRRNDALNQPRARGWFARQLRTLFEEASNELCSVCSLVCGHQYLSPTSVHLDNLKLVAPVSGCAVLDRTSLLEHGIGPRDFLVFHDLLSF